MVVERGSVSFDSITLDNGSTIAPVEVAYQTYGKLNAAKSNAILVEHAFSGDAHAAGIDPETSKTGWWDNMIGPGKASIPIVTSSSAPMYSADAAALRGR